LKKNGKTFLDALYVVPRRAGLRELIEMDREQIQGIKAEPAR